MPGLSAARIFKPCCLPVIEFYGIPILCAERHVSDAADLSPGFRHDSWSREVTSPRSDDKMGGWVFWPQLHVSWSYITKPFTHPSGVGWVAWSNSVPTAWTVKGLHGREELLAMRQDLASLCLSCFLPPHPGAHDSTPLDLLNPTGVGFFIPKVEVMTPTLRAYHDCEASFGKYLEATKYWANANGCSYEISPWVPWPGRVLLETSL